MEFIPIYVKEKNVLNNLIFYSECRSPGCPWTAVHRHVVSSAPHRYCRLAGAPQTDLYCLVVASVTVFLIVMDHLLLWARRGGTYIRIPPLCVVDS